MANDGNKPDTFGIRCTCPSCKGASGKGTLIGVIRDGTYIAEDTTARSYKSAGKVRCTACKAEPWPDVAKYGERDAVAAKRQEDRVKANADAVAAGGMAWEAGIGVVKAAEEPAAEPAAEPAGKAPKAAGSPPVKGKGKAAAPAPAAPAPAAPAPASPAPAAPAALTVDAAAQALADAVLALIAGKVSDGLPAVLAAMVRQ